jgi:DNA polymerase III subunit chi
MTEIGFYHLTRTPVETALPRLLGHTLAAGQRALVVCPSQIRVDELDAVLWTCQDPNWLPHGTRTDGDPHLQPIWIATDDDAPNGAGYLFLIDGANSPRVASFTRVFDLFDGNSEAAVRAARERWTASKAAGHTLTYWNQGQTGWTKGREQSDDLQSP